MFLIILLTPLVFLTCWLLPFVGTVFSREEPSKWVAFWILQIASTWTIIPFLGLIFQCEVQMIAKILIALALIFVLNPGLVSNINKQIESVVSILKHQKDSVQVQISNVAKQYGLIE